MVKILNNILLALTIGSSGFAGMMTYNHTNHQASSLLKLKTVNSAKYTFTKYGAKQGIKTTDIKSVSASSDGKTAFVGTGNQGVYVGNLKNNQWTFTDYTAGLVSNDILTIHSIPSGNMAIAGTPWGINIGIRTNGVWNWNEQYDIYSGLPSYEVNSVTSTSDGKTIYIGTSKGLAVGTLNSQHKYQFKVYKSVLPSKVVLSVYLNEKSNTVFVGTNNGLAVGKISGQQITFTNYHTGLGSPLVYSVFASQDNKYLIAGTHVTDSSFKNGGVSVGILTNGKYKFTNYIKNEPFSKMVNVVTGSTDASTIIVGSSLPANSSSKFGISVGTRSNSKYSFVANNEGLTSAWISDIFAINNAQTIFVAAYFGSFEIGHKVA